MEQETKTTPETLSYWNERIGYWKTRCELSEAYIKETPCDPDTTPEQANAWQAWMDFIKDNE